MNAGSGNSGNPAEKLPREFGKYHLIERIASGGMAELYRAKLFGAGGFEKDLAIKKVLPQLARDESFIKMFMDEAMITVTLSHGNIVSVIDFGEVDGEYFLVMEYVDGVDVQSLIRKSQASGEPFPPPIATYIALEACKGLDYAHRKVGPDGRPLEIVHRDISPQNILISFEGEVKLVDFGIARAASRITSTQAGVVKGKLAYMAPEQIGGQAVDRRADIYSLGVSFYEMLTLRRPFEGATPPETLAAITRGLYDPPHKVNRKVDKKLSGMIAKALERNPKRRYQTAGELAADLASYLHRAGLFPDAATLAAFVSQRLPEARPRTVPPTPIRAIRGEPVGRMNTDVTAPSTGALSASSGAAENTVPLAEAVPFDVLGLEQPPAPEPSDSQRPTDPERPAAPSPASDLLHAPTIIMPEGKIESQAPAKAPAAPEPQKHELPRPQISPELAAAKTMLLEASAQPQIAGVLAPAPKKPPAQSEPAAPAPPPAPAEVPPAPAAVEKLADAWLKESPPAPSSTAAMRAAAFPKATPKGRLLAIAAALLVLSVVGWLIFRPGEESPSPVSISAEAPEQAPAPAVAVPPPPTSESQPAEAPAAPELPTEKTPVVSEKPAEPTSEPAPAGAEETSPASAKAEVPAASPKQKPAPGRQPAIAKTPAPAKTPARKPVEKAGGTRSPVAETPTSEPKVAASEKGFGTLRINSEPFAIVYWGEKRIGPTPQLNLKLPAGSHTLTLRNEALGITRKVRVQIAADQVHTIFVDLHQK